MIAHSAFIGRTTCAKGTVIVMIYMLQPISDSEMLASIKIVHMYYIGLVGLCSKIAILCYVCNIIMYTSACKKHWESSSVAVEMVFPSLVTLVLHSIQLITSACALMPLQFNYAQTYASIIHKSIIFMQFTSGMAHDTSKHTHTYVCSISRLHTYMPYAIYLEIGTHFCITTYLEILAQSIQCTCIYIRIISL